MRVLKECRVATDLVRGSVERLPFAGGTPLAARYRLAFLPPLMMVNNLLARLKRGHRRADIALPHPWVGGVLRAAAWVDQRLGGWLPFGSSVFCVAGKSAQGE